MSELGRLVAGMDVLSSDGYRLGLLKSISTERGYFQVDCPMAPDYYVPVEAVASVDAHCVHLRVNHSQATNMGWEAKPDAG